MSVRFCSEAPGKRAASRLLIGNRGRNAQFNLHTNSRAAPNIRLATSTCSLQRCAQRAESRGCSVRDGDKSIGFLRHRRNVSRARHGQGLVHSPVVYASLPVARASTFSSGRVANGPKEELPRVSMSFLQSANVSGGKSTDPAAAHCMASRKCTRAHTLIAASMTQAIPVSRGDSTTRCGLGGLLYGSCRTEMSG